MIFFIKEIKPAYPVTFLITKRFFFFLIYDKVCEQQPFCMKQSESEGIKSWKGRFTLEGGARCSQIGGWARILRGMLCAHRDTTWPVTHLGTTHESWPVVLLMRFETFLPRLIRNALCITRQHMEYVNLPCEITLESFYSTSFMKKKCW